MRGNAGGQRTWLDYGRIGRTMYNLLTEEWIRATSKDGTSKEYGILDLILNSQELLGITDDSPIIEYGIYRFLFAFLMDAYQPETVFDITELLERGSFDAEVIHNYITLCEGEGVSFDIFDQANPFMQETIKDDIKRKSVAALNPIVPTGTSRTFFDHGLENTRSFSKAEAARALFSTTIFPRGGSGYYACISGEGLVFNILMGKNLFETLVFGMVSKSDTHLDYGKPYWRDKGFAPKEKRVDTTLLYGLTFPIRQVNLLEESEELTTIHFAPGLNPSIEYWRDPYVAYQQGKDKLYPMRASQDQSTGALKSQWRNISTIAKKTDGILILRNAVEKEDVRVVSYAILVNNAIQNVDRSEFLLPICIYTDESKNEQVQEEIQKCEEIASLLRKSMHDTLNRGKTKVADSAVRDYIFRYYNQCETAFNEQITGTIDIDSWMLLVGDIAVAGFNDFVDKYCIDSDRIAEAIKQRNNMCIKLGKMGWKKTTAGN